jgi:hypothetical protein
MNWRDVALIVVVFKLRLAGVYSCTEVNCLIVELKLRGYNFISCYGGALGGLRVA